MAVSTSTGRRWRGYGGSEGRGGVGREREGGVWSPWQVTEPSIEYMYSLIRTASRPPSRASADGDRSRCTRRSRGRKLALQHMLSWILVGRRGEGHLYVRVCAESLNSMPVVGKTLAPMKPLVAPQVVSTGVDDGIVRCGDETMKPSPDLAGAAAKPGPERLVCSAPKPKSTPVAESTGSLMLFRWEPRDARRSKGGLEVAAAA